MAFNKMTIQDVNLKDKRILMRLNFSVPMKDGMITNNQRIATSLDTIRYALEHGARSVVILSHLGRPHGRRMDKFSLKPVAEELESLLGRKVLFMDDCLGPEVEVVCTSPAPGSVILLENVRFHPEEEGKGLDHQGNKIVPDEANVRNFRACLTKLGDIFVNDGFGTAHRAHSSQIGIDLPLRVAGFQMRRELDYFSKVLDNPQRPFLVILGGAKVEEKILLIENLLNLADEMIIGGGMAFPFLQVLHNMEIGASLTHGRANEIVPRIMAKARSRGVPIHLPCDFVTAEKFDEKSSPHSATLEFGISPGWVGLDCGPASTAKFCQVIESARTVVWNGPMGVFEWDSFSTGSRLVLNKLVEVTAKGAVTVVGGGDTATCCAKWGLEDRISHVSTGGGASLVLLEGRVLPGVAALTNSF